jgi:hypothetical protein
MIIINVEGNGSYWTQLPNGANNFQSHDITEILLKVALSTINQCNQLKNTTYMYSIFV